MIYDRVIVGGTLVTASGPVQADLAIQGERIAAIGRGLEGRHVLDARARLVIPGGVDPHVHLQMPSGATVSSDDWLSGTRAAALGGTTTVIDFVEPEPGQSLLEAYAQRRAEAEGRAAIDYGLHMTLSQPALAHLDELPDVVAAGLTSFKTYTTYAGFALDDAAYLRALSAARAAGGIVLAHCETDALIQAATHDCLARGQTGPQAHPQSRPAAAEAEAIRHLVALNAGIGAPLYIVHLSSAAGIAALTEARARVAAPVFAETCPQYLFLDDSCYAGAGFGPARFVCSPPLRSPADQAALRAALRMGVLQTVGTDHCPFNFAGQKDLGREDFTRIPGGLPGIEARLALIYTLIVELGAPLERWVEVCCSAPARLFGLYPRKGTLLPGADADVVIFNPAREVTITHDRLHEHVDYTPYEGLTARGWPEVTLSRGVVIAQDGSFIGSPGEGCFLRREPFTPVV